MPNYTYSYSVSLPEQFDEETTKKEFYDLTNEITTILRKNNLNYHFDEGVIESVYFLNHPDSISNIIRAFETIRQSFGDRTFTFEIYDKDNNLIKQLDIDTLDDPASSIKEFLQETINQ